VAVVGSAAGWPVAVRSVAAPPVRIGVHTVSVVPAGDRCTVSVELRRGDDRALGLLEGVMATSVARRLVAEATLTALATLVPSGAETALDAVVVVPVGDHTVATVTVALVVASREETVVGAAVVRAAGIHDAVARAALDAASRRFSACS